MDITVFIVHRDPLVRKGIVSLVQETPALAIVGEADDPIAAVRLMHRLRPDVGVIELSASDSGGLLVCDIMKTKGLATRIIFLSPESCGAQVHRAVTAGATGYLTRDVPTDNLVHAIVDAADGKLTLSQSAQAALQTFLQKKDAWKPQTTTTRSLLSDMELQVLKYTAYGLSIADTSRRLHISVSTVKNHRQSLVAKLGVPNTQAAVYAATQRGLLQ